MFTLLVPKDLPIRLRTGAEHCSKTDLFRRHLHSIFKLRFQDGGLRVDRFGCGVEVMGFTAEEDLACFLSLEVSLGWGICLVSVRFTRTNPMKIYQCFP